MADHSTRGASIGQPPAWVLDPLLAYRGTMEGRVLRALATSWGDGRDTAWRDSILSSGLGATTPDLAAKLKIVPQTSERQQLEDSLSFLRRKGLVHFEFNRTVDMHVRWWLTTAGREVADRLV